MCGRYQIKVDIESLLERYGIYNLDFNYMPMDEVYPSNESPVIISEGKKKVLKKFRWGFPAFNNKLIINARSETVKEKEIFRSSFIHRRCLIPASSFYEWDRQSGEGIKKVISLKDENIFSMAGIYNSFTDKKGNSFYAFTILTTSSIGEIFKFHSRMPLILNKKDEDKWINNKFINKCLKDIMKPFEGGLTIKSL